MPTTRYGGDRMRLPSWVRRIWAGVTGTFWLPCPLCGDSYGGYEANGAGIPDVSRQGVYRMVCPKRGCQERAE